MFLVWGAATDVGSPVGTVSCPAACQARVWAPQIAHSPWQGFAATMRTGPPSSRLATPAIRNLGICMELGADLTRHWWGTGISAGAGRAQVVEAGAWPAGLSPSKGPPRARPTSS